MSVHHRILLKQDDSRSWNHRSPTLVGVDQPGETFEQGRLARAIASDQRQPVLRSDMHIDAAEQPAFTLDQAERFIGKNGGCHREPPSQRTAPRHPAQTVVSL